MGGLWRMVVVVVMVIVMTTMAMGMAMRMDALRDVALWFCYSLVLVYGSRSTELDEGAW